MLNIHQVVREIESKLVSQSVRTKKKFNLQNYVLDMTWLNPLSFMPLEPKNVLPYKAAILAMYYVKWSWELVKPRLEHVKSSQENFTPSWDHFASNWEHVEPSCEHVESNWEYVESSWNTKDHILKVSCHYLYLGLKYSFEEVCRQVGWWDRVVFVKINSAGKITSVITTVLFIYFKG